MTVRPRTVFIILGALALVTVLLFRVLGTEGRRIGECARDAMVLSRTAQLVGSSLYPDADHFLGKEPRLFEKEHLEALERAYQAARRSALSASAHLLTGALNPLVRCSSLPTSNGI